MKVYAHLASGLGLGTLLTLIPGLDIDLLTAVPFSLLGSILPDIVHPPRRRNPFLHSLLGALIVPALFVAPLYLLVSTVSPLPLPPSTAVSWYRVVALCYLLHLLCDSLTAGGIYLAYPSKRRFRLASRPYDDPVLNAGVAAVGALTTIIVLILRELPRPC